MAFPPGVDTFATVEASISCYKVVIDEYMRPIMLPSPFGPAAISSWELFQE